MHNEVITLEINHSNCNSIVEHSSVFINELNLGSLFLRSHHQMQSIPVFCTTQLVTPHVPQVNMYDVIVMMSCTFFTLGVVRDRCKAGY